VLGELRAPRSQLEERILRGLREHGATTTRNVQAVLLNGSVKYDRVKNTLERMLEDGAVTVAESAREPGKAGRPGRLWAASETEPDTSSTPRSAPSTRSYKARGVG
jgi:predicted ArsR family transcriptional regulator